MPHNGPLKMSVATAQDLLAPATVFVLLAFLSALLSPQSTYLLFFLLVVLIAGWGARTLGFCKVNDPKLISIIFPDGLVKLESAGNDIIGGYLDGQQWCIDWFAILRINSHGTTRTLLFLSAQQCEDDYRRLITWLRCDRFNGNEKSSVPGI